MVSSHYSSLLFGRVELKNEILTLGHGTDGLERTLCCTLDPGV